MQMKIAKASKALAGMVVTVAVAWLATLTGFEVPESLVEWAGAALGTAIAAGLGFAAVWFAPKNED